MLVEVTISHGWESLAQGPGGGRQQDPRRLRAPFQSKPRGAGGRAEAAALMGKWGNETQREAVACLRRDASPGPELSPNFPNTQAGSLYAVPCHWRGQDPHFPLEQGTHSSSDPGAGAGPWGGVGAVSSHMRTIQIILVYTSGDHLDSF